MESLESKLDRVSPEQRKEIEDFVDFLLSRAVYVCAPPNASRDILPVPSLTAPPPLTLIEPVHVMETPSVRLQDLVRTDDLGASAARDEPVPVPFQEIGGGSDRITHDYMDYGQFDHQPSPATVAVKKIKRTIVAREGQEKPRHLLDWVD
jgi:hypothetical protein